MTPKIGQKVKVIHLNKGDAPRSWSCAPIEFLHCTGRIVSFVEQGLFKGLIRVRLDGERRTWVFTRPQLMVMGHKPRAIPHINTIVISNGQITEENTC